MRCERIDALLPAYLDGDLPGRLNRHVSDHLDGCERCRDELAAQQRAVRQLDAGRHPVTIDLWADFSRRLQVQNQPAPSAWLPSCRPGYVVALGAAAVALVALTAPRPGFVATTGTAPPVGMVATVSRPSRVVPAMIRPPAPAAAEGRPHQGYRLAMAPAVETPMPVGRRLRSQSAALPSTGLRVERSAHRRTSSWRRRRPGHLTAPEPRTVLVAARPELSPELAGIDLPASAGRMNEEPERPSMLSARRAADAAAAAASHSRSGGSLAHMGDPLRVAEALVSVEQDAASDQMKGELLRLAQEVARVGGEDGAGSSPDTSASDAPPVAEHTPSAAGAQSEERGERSPESSSRQASPLSTLHSSLHGD